MISQQKLRTYFIDSPLLNVIFILFGDPCQVFQRTSCYGLKTQISVSPKSFKDIIKFFFTQSWVPCLEAPPG